MGDTIHTSQFCFLNVWPYFFSISKRTVRALVLSCQNTSHKHTRPSCHITSLTAYLVRMSSEQRDMIRCKPNRMGNQPFTHVLCVW